jgi:hypothetical protein
MSHWHPAPNRKFFFFQAEEASSFQLHVSCKQLKLN